MRAVKKWKRRDSGIALLTSMLILLLLSSMLVGFILLISSGQKLSGINNDYSKAFYGGEAAMEKMTADIGTLFDTNYSPTGPQITAIETSAPSLPGINYVQASGSSGYVISFPTDSSGNPLASTNVINSGAYQGMTALQTLYTLNVTARTTLGSEVKLQRTVQTVGIPVFQFGVFSQTDLSFFPGQPFNFGGRTATNGNLFLASVNGVTLSQPVTAVGQIIRTNLSNGNTSSSGWAGTVNVDNGSGTRPLATTEGSLVGTLGSAANPNWSTISLGSADYAGNLRNGTTGVDPLNLGIVLLGNGTTQPIDLIRRPYVGESTSVTNLRYFAQASLQILLSDNPTDIMSLPCVEQSTQPFNLASLAMPVANWTGTPATTLRTNMTTNNNAGYNTPPVPLAASGASQTATGYNPADGYWLPNPSGIGYGPGSGLPIVQGYIKISVQTAYGNPCGTWQDVTLEVLGYGYAGRNLNPQTGLTSPSGYGSAEPLLTLGTTEVAAPTLTGASATPCEDVHPNALIRLERVRDNPSNYANTNANTRCGALNSTGTPTTATQVAPDALVAGTTEVGVPADYWPSTLFDTREGLIRANSPTGTLGTINYSTMPTLGGVMRYIEVDAKNVAAYLAGTGVYAGKSGHLSYDSVNAPNDYTLYISDRRGNYTASALTNVWPPLSPSGNETGEYGWNDFVNPADPNGCPNGIQDAGEDLDGLGSTGFYTYGQNPTHVMAAGAVPANATLNQVTTSPGYLGYGQYGMYISAAPGNLYGAATTNAITANTSCTVTTPSTIWPGDYVVHANEARENPNPFFRRAVKIMDGNLLTGLGMCPGSVPCGLAIATENPVYMQGDFNANSALNGFTDPDVAVSVNADAVTMLSNNWNDVNSFIFPYQQSGNQRDATNTYFRTAIMAGKGVSFPMPTYTPAPAGDFGTDGGVHNFLRFIESWNNGGVTLNYEGSIISMFTNRQAIGAYKSSTLIYSPPTRAYVFDVNFLTPSLLPPRTPLFRDVNTTGFTQLLLPTQ